MTYFGYDFHLICHTELYSRERKERQRQAVKRHRKRKNEEVQKLKDDAIRLCREKQELEKQLQKYGGNQAHSVEASQVCQRRREILHDIWETWNLKGIEDMRILASRVYHERASLVSPDYSDDLKGIPAIMNHWQNLFEAFPDGMMDEYNICDQDEWGEKFRVNWVFSGTQALDIFGISPRQQHVQIKGLSFVTFEGMKIKSMVLSWNYREALMALMGVTKFS